MLTSIQKEFLSYVKKTRNCWLWLGKMFKYGGVSGTISKFTKQQSAHRAAWVLFKGPIPEDKPHVLHHCDNPQCVRWTGKKHLFVGTQLDNMRDMLRKGRQNYAKGDSHYRVVISLNTAQKILEKFKTKRFTQRHLARQFKLRPETIHAIAHKRGRFKSLKG